jgi:uncharacterized damage-inducible protein DinB
VHPVRALFSRNAWATRELMRSLRGVDPDLLERETPGTYGPVSRTLSHLCGNEQHYLSLLTGEPAQDPIQRGERRDLPALERLAEDSASRWRSLLDSSPDPERLTWHESEGRRTKLAGWVVMVQCVHHGDVHRAHVGTLLGAAGAEGPNLSGWAFGSRAEHGEGASGGWADSLLLRFFDFSGWATQTLLEHCLGLGDRALRATAPGTYGTVHETLTHLVEADSSFLGLLVGSQEAYLEGSADPDTLRSYARRSREGWRAYLEAAPDHERVIEDSHGRAPAWVPALQAVHHLNDHIAHVETILGANGLPLVATDVWAYGAVRDGLVDAGPA